MQPTNGQPGQVLAGPQPSALSPQPPALPARCRALLVALAVDALLSDPPNGVHPVVWIGRWLSLGEHIAPEGAAPRLAWGAGWVAAGGALAAALAGLAPRDALAQGGLAATLLAYRGLDRAVGEVQSALARGDLPEARRLLGWHLVSRPTGDLRADEVAGAAIESLAENLSDSLVAPALAYLAGGLPGLALYRVSNTADAMWGYRTPRYEYLGKAPARLDDLLNLLPARLTAALLVAAAQLTRGTGGAAWAAARRDAAGTASPNAGWPMAAMAGALGTVLEKRGHYALGDGPRVPSAAMVAEARAVARGAVLLFVAVVATGAIVKARHQ